jgi:hypothetical protein
MLKMVDSSLEILAKQYGLNLLIVNSWYQQNSFFDLES